MIHASIQGWFQPALAHGAQRAHRRAAAWLQSLQVTGRLGAPVERAEQDGLVFAFRARGVAVLIIGAWLLLIVSWPRDVYYLSLAGALFLFGYVPFRLRRHRYAMPIKLAFTVMDVTLVTMAILMQPPAGLAMDWPIQTRTRGPEFLFMLLLLGEAALTYSPIRVVWTGISIAAIWSVGITAVSRLATTRPSIEAVSRRGVSDTDLLQVFLDPLAVSRTTAMTQIIVTLLLTALLAVAVLRGRMHLLAQVRAEALRSDFARYVSPDVADALTERVASGFGEPVERHVAVLFADIVGFTGATETLPPSQTFALLRSFQERSSARVLDHQGTIDKFLGDGLMATFGALRDDENASARALACAGALIDEVARWNNKRRRREAPPMRVAVGLHCGTVTVGNLGSERRMEFTVVGDVVNVASRLEKAARELDCSLVVSDACVRAAGERASGMRFRRQVELRVRGRDAPLLVHVAGGSDI